MPVVTRRTRTTMRKRKGRRFFFFGWGIISETRMAREVSRHRKNGCAEIGAIHPRTLHPAASYGAKFRGRDAPYVSCETASFVLAFV